MRQVLTDTENMINREGIMKKHIAYLKSLRACSDATVFAEHYGSMREVWEACRRPDWMLWLLNRINHMDDRAYRLYACWCVRHTPLPDGGKVWDLLTDERSRAAIVVAERFADGAATKQELDAARVSARAAASSDAAYAAYAAAYDAAPRAAAYDAAAYAAYAARSAAYAAYAARSAADAAYAAALDAQSSHLRVVFPWHTIESLMSI